MHALRLGLQGIELLSTGRITLPVPEPHRGYLRSVRRGERPLAEVPEAVSDAGARLAALRGSPAGTSPPSAEPAIWLAAGTSPRPWIRQAVLRGNRRSALVVADDAAN